MRARLFLIFPCLLLAMFSGCGRQNVATVSGRVTVDGKPAADCSVMFTLVTNGNGASISAVGVTDAEGRYTLKTLENTPINGAGIGENRVILKWIDKEYPFTWIEHKAPKRKSAPYALPLQARSGKMRFTVPADGTENADFVF